MKSTTRILSGLILCAGLTTATLADDTDIYLDPLIPAGSKPLVMFYIDFRQNLSGSGCNAGNCQALIDDGFLPDATGSKFDVLRAILKKVLSQIKGVKVGWMMPHNNSSGAVSIPGNKASQGEGPKSNGGFIVTGFGDVEDAVHLANFHDRLDLLPTPTNNNTAHDTQLTETYFEFYRYLLGEAVVNAHNSGADVAGGVLSDPAIEAANGSYISPLAGQDCSKVFTVNITDGKIGFDDDSNFLIDDSIASGGMNLSLPNNADNAFADVLEFLKDADLGSATFPQIGVLDGKQSVVSYFFVSNSALTPQGVQWAAAGGTGSPYDLDADPDVVVDALSNIFKSILAVSTSFVAPSVPVNVFNRAQTVNEVFLALFEADENGLPYWNGNLKKVVIDKNPVSQILELQDANGNPAIDVDGRLRRDAVTFWTDVADLPPVADPLEEVAGADGRAITRGGAGQQVIGIVSGNPQTKNITAGSRKLYIENPLNSFVNADDAVLTDELTPLDASVAVATQFWQELAVDSGISAAANYGAATAAEQARAIDALEFARGLESDGATPSAWMMADPLHSRPRPINYGARTGFSINNPDIRILVGSNDGFMRMIQNTDTDANSAAQLGNETWAFMPKASLKYLDRIQQNLAGSPKHPNSTDGSPVVLTKDADLSGTIGDNVADQALAFFSMRRGGRNLYALDITDPDNPKFKWRIEGGTGDFAELGQSWSLPSLGKVKLETAPGVFTFIDVLVFGGGYHGDDIGDKTWLSCDSNVNASISGAGEVACRDNDVGKDFANRVTRHNKGGLLPVVPVSEGLGTDDTRGNAIFIVNAQTGALIWKVRGKSGVSNPTFFAADKALEWEELKDSFPAEITAVDTVGDGVLDRILAADTGGNVFRIDLGDFVDVDSNPVTPDLLVQTDIKFWQIVKLLEAGRHDTSNVTNDRRFFNRVDIAQTRDDVGPFDAVLLGSGDRENPLATSTEDWFYLVKDRKTGVGDPPSSTLNQTDLADLSNNCLQDTTKTLSDCGIDANKFNDGWRIKLNAASGEKNLAASVTSGGNVFFTTFAPTPVTSTCGLSEGEGRFYAVSLDDATAIFNFDSTNDGGGTTYERSDVLGSGGIPVEVVPLGGGLILVQGQEVGENIVATGGKTGFKTFWHELPDL